MKIKDIAKIHSCSMSTVKNLILKGTKADGTACFTYNGITYNCAKENNGRKNASWIMSLSVAGDDVDVKQNLEKVKAESLDSENFLFKKEQLKLKKLLLETEKLSENLESTKQALRAEIFEEVMDSTQKALLAIHKVYMDNFKPNSKDKEIIEKELTKTLEALKNG